MFHSDAIMERTYKCKNCGTYIEIPYYCREWGWWYGVHFCCSFKCMNEMRKKDMPDIPADKPGKSRAPLNDDEKRTIEELILLGHSNERIAIAVNRSKSAVGNIRKRMVREGRWTQ